MDNSSSVTAGSGKTLAYLLPLLQLLREEEEAARRPLSEPNCPRLLVVTPTNGALSVNCSFVGWVASGCCMASRPSCCDDPDALHECQAQIPPLLAELCSQVVGIVRDLAREAPLRSLAVTGGHNLRSQSKNLSQVTLDISPA